MAGIWPVAVPAVAVLACTRERAVRISADGPVVVVIAVMAVVDALGAFINVHALGAAVAPVASTACAVKGACLVDATRDRAAVRVERFDAVIVGRIVAFVVVGTEAPVANGTRWARAVEATREVCAYRRWIAQVGRGRRAFVDIDAFSRGGVQLKARIAPAFPRACKVRAEVCALAIMGTDGALVDLRARTRRLLVANRRARARAMH